MNDSALAGEEDAAATHEMKGFCDRANAIEQRCIVFDQMLDRYGAGCHIKSKLAIFKVFVAFDCSNVVLQPAGQRGLLIGLIWAGGHDWG